MLLITGANGQLGRLIVEEVLRREPDVDLAVSVRDVEAAGELSERGVEVRRGDYAEPETMAAAFEGVDHAFLMSTPTPDPDERVALIRPVIDAALSAGVSHLIYPGAPLAEGAELPLPEGHARAFEAIEQSGVAATYLQNAIYAEVIAGDVAGALQSGELAAPAGDARVAPVLRSDIAAATAAVLLDPAPHAGKTYELTGADSVGWQKLADLASERAGREIPYRSISMDEARERLIAGGIPEQYIPTMLGFYDAYRAGWSATATGDVERLSGRPATPALEAIAAVLDGTAK